MQKRKPSIFLSLLSLLLLICMLAFVIWIFRDEALDGAIQLVLLFSAATISAIAVFYCGISWSVIEERIVHNFKDIATALIILLLIGALAGSWMVSGIVPTLIYYGLHSMQSNFFLVSTFLICCIVSLITGSSWTTIATIGIALLGVGQLQGFNPGWIAGAVISGAYFGDKISPISDTTVLAATATETPLFEHVKYMLYTTIPAMIITLIVYAIAGYSRQVPDASEITKFAESLAFTFNISPWLMIVPLTTVIMIIRKFSSIIVLFTSSIMAAVFAIFFQPNLLHSIAGDIDMGIIASIKAAMISLFGSTDIQTGNAALDNLVSTSGMAGMRTTIWLIICAICFSGAMSASGMMASITLLFERMMRGRFSTVSATAAAGITFNLTTADQYISIILNGEMFKEAFRKKGFEGRLLSRTTEDAVTVTSPLIPWSSCGMTQATVLGVATLTYLPYCIFNIVSPIMSILVAAVGYKILQAKK
jgi:NhaC family Na+:H+ antiporter